MVERIKLPDGVIKKCLSCGCEQDTYIKVTDHLGNVENKFLCEKCRIDFIEKLEKFERRDSIGL